MDHALSAHDQAQPGARDSWNWIHWWGGGGPAPREGVSQHGPTAYAKRCLLLRASVRVTIEGISQERIRRGGPRRTSPYRFTLAARTGSPQLEILPWPAMGRISRLLSYVTIRRNMAALYPTLECCSIWFNRQFGRQQFRLAAQHPSQTVGHHDPLRGHLRAGWSQSYPRTGSFAGLLTEWRSMTAAKTPST